MELVLAKCCGTCENVNKPKNPEPHAAHYTVAKTERWCYKHNKKTIREAYCNDHCFGKKIGVKSTLTKVMNMNKRIDKLIEIKEYMLKNNLTFEGIDKWNEKFKFSVKNGKVIYTRTNSRSCYNEYDDDVRFDSYGSSYDLLIQVYELELSKT